MTKEQNKISIILIRGKRLAWSGETSVTALMIGAVSIIFFAVLLGASLNTLGSILSDSYETLASKMAKSLPGKTATDPPDKTATEVPKSSMAEITKDQKISMSPSPEPPLVNKDTSAQSPAAPSHQVAIEDFEINHDRRSEKLRFKFSLINRMERSTLSGYVYLILRPADARTGSYLTYPQAVLDNQGVPVNFKDGEFFSINRFRVFTKTIPARGSFSLADIIVFSNRGKVLLKQSFPVKSP